MEIVAGDSAGEVVAEAQGEVEAIETGEGEGVEILSPEGAVVEPGFVFGFGEEGSGNAADFVGGGFDDGRGEMERRGGVFGVPDAVGEFEDAVDEAAGVDAGDEDGGEVVVGWVGFFGGDGFGS